MDAAKPSLYVYSREGDFKLDVTPSVVDYRHEWQEGPYSAYFKINADGKPSTVDDIRRWFSTRFMYQVRVRFAGSEVWRGFVGKMALHAGGWIYTKDIKNLDNAVKSSWQWRGDDNILRTVYTRWYENEESIRKYGRFEKVINYSSGMLNSSDFERDPETGIPLEAAETFASAWCAKHATPYAGQVIQDPSYDGTDYIEIYLYGAMQLANRIYCSDGALGYEYSADTLPWQREYYESLRDPGPDSYFYKNEYNHGDEIKTSSEILRIIDVVGYQTSKANGDPLLSRATTDTTLNARPVAAGVSVPIGAFDQLRNLTQLTDENGTYYRLRVELHGAVAHEPISSLAPRYYSYRAPRGLIENRNKVPTWDARPGLMKIRDEDITEYLSDTWLGDKSLVWYDSVTMRDGADAAQFSGFEFNQFSYDSARAAALNRLKRKKK